MGSFLSFIIPFVIWFSLCALASISGLNKKVGYWGVFWVGVFLSPVVGLIRGLVGPSEFVPYESQDPSAQALSDMILPVLGVAFTFCYGYAIFDLFIK